MRGTAALVAAGALTLAACASDSGTTGGSGTTGSASAPPAATPAVAGATGTAGAAAGAESCLPIAQIQEARVRSDSVIDFHTAGGKVYRSTLPNRCPQLGFERAFTYSTSLSQLCSTDIISVVRQAGGPMRGASCGLGPFVPISKEQAAADL